MRNQRFRQSDSSLNRCSNELPKKAASDGKITARDAELITEFINDLTTKISPVHEYRLTIVLILNREFFPEYETITTVDVQRGIKNILTAEDLNGNPRFKKNYLVDRIRLAKRFFLWMIKNGHGENLNKEKIMDIVPPKADLMTKKATDLLTKEEVEAMISAAGTSRDRAIIATLYEAGLRSRELGDLIWSDLKFTSWNVVVNTAGKTGKPRYIPLVMARPYLAQWKNDYPGEIDPNRNVFVNLICKNENGTMKHLPITYVNLCYIIKTTAKKSGIQKKITPHLFRHSRITHLIQDGVQETFIKKMMWGNMTTNMFQTYAHIVNDDLDKCVAELNGISIDDEAETKKKKKCLHPVQCPICGTVNTSTAKFCCECSAPLKEDVKTDSDRRRAAVELLLSDEKNIVELLTYYQNKIRNKNEGATCPSSCVR